MYGYSTTLILCNNFESKQSNLKAAAVALSENSLKKEGRFNYIIITILFENYSFYSVINYYRSTGTLPLL